MKTQQISAANGFEKLMQVIGFPESDGATETGVFKGKIVSAKTGARVFGVVVELVGSGRTYITSPSGYFKMDCVPEGIYVARFSFPGFKEVTEVVAILNGESLDMTLALEVV